MSSSFFYSQDTDCPICSPTLHSSFLDIPSSSRTPSGYFDLPIMDHYEHESTTSAKHTINTRRPIMGSRQTTTSSNSSITSNSSTTTASSSSSSSSRAPSSSGKTIKKALSRLSPARRRKSAEATRPEPTLAPPRTASAPLPRRYHISFDESPGAEIHPYDFFQASLYMGDDSYTVLEDGWLRLRSGRGR